MKECGTALSGENRTEILGQLKIFFGILFDIWALPTGEFFVKIV